MKRLLGSCIALGVLLAAGAMYFVCNCRHERIVDIDSDGNRNLYTITEYEHATVFSRINQENKITNAVRLPEYMGKSKVTYRDVTIGENMTFVLYDYEDETSHTLSIDAYNTKLKKQNTVFSQSYPKGTELVTSLKKPRDSERMYLAVVADSAKACYFGIDCRSYEVAEKEEYRINVALSVRECTYTVYGMVLTDAERFLYVIDGNGDTIKIPADITAEKLGQSGLNAEYFDIRHSAVYACELFNFLGQGLESDKTKSPLIYLCVGPDARIADSLTMKDIDQVWFFNDYTYGLVVSDERNGHDTIYFYGAEAVQEYTLRGMTVFQMLLLSGLLFLVAFAVLFLGGLGIRVLLNRRKIATKQILSTFGIVVIAFFPLYAVIRLFCLSFVEAEATTLLFRYLASVENNLNADSYAKEGVNERLCEFIDRMLEANELHKPIRTDNRLVNSLYGNELFHELFFDIAYEENGEYYYAVSDNARANVKYFFDSEVLKEILSLEEGKTLISKERAENRDWLAVAAPVFSSDGVRQGFIQIGINRGNIESVKAIYSMAVTAIAELIILLITFVFVVSFKRRVRPLDSIKKAVNEIADGRLSEMRVINTNDELQDISYSFNRMSVKLNQYFDNINTVSQVYQKFVPKEFYHLLGKDSILDLQLNDTKEKDVNFMFIRTSQNIITDSTEENYRRLSLVYRAVTEGIEELNGSIHKDDDNRILCLFEKEISASVTVALEIRERIMKAIGSSQSVSISILHDRSLFGIVGNENSMRCVIVSEAVTLQKQLDRILEQYRLGLLLNEDSYRKVKEDKSSKIRRIGCIRDLLQPTDDYGGAEQMLYEVVDAEEPERRRLMELTLESFNEGLLLYEAGDYLHARERFIDVLRVDRNDLIARNFLNRIEEKTNV